MVDLVLDIGNSRIKGGLFDGKQLVGVFAIASHPMPKEELLRHLENKPIANVLVSSVNAKADEAVKATLEQKQIPFRFLDYSKLKLILDVDEPEQLGHDRIANSYGALARFPLNDCIVVDVGTAITVDFVVKEGRYLGGMIYPGPMLCAKALNDYTDKLPLVSLQKPESALAKTTVTHLQGGIYYGQLGAIERMIAELSLCALSPSSVKVIATGGAIYCPRSSFVDFDSARRSQIEAKRPNEEDHSRIGKADEEDRFGKVAASQNSQNLSGGSIHEAFADDLKELVDLIDPHLTLQGLREMLEETKNKE